MIKQQENFKEMLEDIKEAGPRGELEEALYRILNTNRLDVAKEIAADALNEDIEEYLDDEPFTDACLNDYEDLEFTPNDEEYPY